MTRYKLRKYLTIVPLTIVLLASSCAYEYWRFYQNFFYTSLSEQNKFLNLTGDNGNYADFVNIVAFYSVIFILFLFYLFPNDKPINLIRLKSRNAFVTSCIADCAIFAFIFAFIIEAVSVTAALIAFDINIIFKFNFLQFTVLELLTLFLFYFRAGLLLLVFEIIVPKKAAPFLTLAIYLIEFFTESHFMLSKVWFPFRDAMCVSELMVGEMRVSDILGIVLRALVMILLLIFSAYFLYKKKDVLSDTKK